MDVPQFMDGSLASTANENYHRQRTVQLAQRAARSKDGCVTCKRRKVKCDESRPRCAHCERLNMECKWPLNAGTGRQKRSTSTFPSVGSAVSASEQGVLPQTPPGQLPDGVRPARLAANDPARVGLEQIFDYASFNWDAGLVWHPPPVSNMTNGAPVQYDPNMMEAEYQNHDPLQVQPSSHSATTHPDLGSVNGSENNMSELVQVASNNSQGIIVPQGPVADNHRLMDYFIHAVTPPILAEVETQKKWFTMRQVLVTMANASRMVRWAILAFSSQLLCRRDGAWMASEHNHYENSAAEVAASSEESNASWVEHSIERENLLAALFFLSYVDILEGRIEAAHAHLKQAYGVFQQAQRATLTSTEKQLLLWLRLLDARAVSAGGDGLFLSEDDEDLLIQTSTPASLPMGGDGSLDETSVEDGDMEDVLFQVLYQPGVLFFQKVQSFMGRISKIDPWHRSRGTVEDEIEVMNAGAAIAADLKALYDQRPLLMDYAVVGRLTAPYISAHLAFVVSRAFRTHLSNYYASKIHLHRVAYKQFPLTTEAVHAINQIRRLSKLIAEGLDAEDAMPVSMLWPLLMLGSEEQDREERLWIKTQILRMERVAGNARITAQVLEEVQARQDATKTRVDIRSVMHAIFNSCFAIV